MTVSDWKRQAGCLIVSPKTGPCLRRARGTRAAGASNVVMYRARRRIGHDE